MKIFPQRLSCFKLVSLLLKAQGPGFVSGSVEAHGAVCLSKGGENEFQMGLSQSSTNRKCPLTPGPRSGSESALGHVFLSQHFL